MTLSKYRFGILGSGYMGRTHSEAIHRVAESELIAVTGGTRAPALSADYGVHYEDSLEKLLQRNDIDAVVITTPHSCHYEETLLALQSGKHVLVEKPMATQTLHCDQMIELAKKKGLALGIGYHQRFRENNFRARELIRQGVIGTVTTIQISMPMFAGAMKSGGFGGDWSWWNDPKSLGHIFNSAPHSVDLMRWFMNAEVKTVSAFSRTLIPNNVVEDTSIALLEFSNGAICSLFSSRALPSPAFIGEEYRIRITGTKGLIDLDPYGELKVSDENGWRTVSSQPSVGHEGASSAFGDIRMKAYSDQIASFIDLIEGKPSNIGQGLDGRAAVEVCDAILQSSSKHGWINL
jgi:predicted dehydrogenase